MAGPADFAMTFPRVLRELDWEDRIKSADVRSVRIPDVREVLVRYSEEIYLGVAYESRERNAGGSWWAKAHPTLRSHHSLSASAFLAAWRGSAIFPWVRTTA